ncbi:MAG TPA: glycosyltransferase family 39 protein [Candidatus Bathyarchaeia archaeon]|nr:glycosyltransferase family 39 protein [Candidatus Bathyarchaeia archaeon]
MKEKNIEALRVNNPQGVGFSRRRNKKTGVKEDLKKMGTLLLLVFLFMMALAPRLWFIFRISEPIDIPMWYGDVFHHWQIAYLSKEIGFKQGFLRLWDLKGMEFFWGLIHPLVLVILFTLTGSSNILVPRLLSVVCGSLNIVLLYLILKREFNWQTGLAAAILASFFPITLFSNTVGMQEELGMFFIFLGIFFWPKSPAGTGLLFGLAAMERTEYWLFTCGLVLALILRSKNFDKKIILGLSYLVVNLFYMKYLDFWTGNAIYPIYWNFISSVKGEWFVELPINGAKLVAQQINRVVFFFGLIGGLLTFWKKPKGFLLLLFGFSNLVFIGFMLGFGAYVKGFAPRVWTDRLFNWPYLFSLILILIFLFWVVPNKARFWAKIKLNWLIFFGILVLSWQLWQPIIYFWNDVGKFNYEAEKEKAGMIAKHYQKGSVLIPEDRPILTYFLTNDFAIKGENIRGQMFDPFFYAKTEPLDNWGEFRKEFRDWLETQKIELLFISSGEHRALYQQAALKEPDWFELLEEKEGSKVYRVILPPDSQSFD